MDLISGNLASIHWPSILRQIFEAATDGGVASRGDVLAYLSIDDTPGPFYDAANLTWKTPREGKREHG